MPLFRSLGPRRYRFRAGRIADHGAPAREQRRAIDADAGERQARLALRDDPAVGVEHEVAARVVRRVVDQHQVRIARRFGRQAARSEEHTSELQSLMRISYAVFCLKKKNTYKYKINTHKYSNN